MARPSRPACRSASSAATSVYWMKRSTRRCSLRSTTADGSNSFTSDSPSVRAVAATYLGIIHEGADTAVPALVEALSDPDPEVRRTSAAALGSFEQAAAPALPALRKAAVDRNEDVAREAGLAIVKIQEQK